MAPPSSSSTPPTTRPSSCWAARAPSPTWPVTSPTPASTTTASITSPPTATSGGSSSNNACPPTPDEQHFCELALKLSGAIQAARWTRLADGTGFIHSFNGPHSLFVDTLRSGRALALAHLLGHVLLGEQDVRISLLDRLLEHTLNTARYNIYYGTGRDAYDVRGRTAHEAVFNTASGVFRCPNTQQGYSPFSTWTRGLAWAVCGFAEQLEFLRHLHGHTHPPAPTNATRSAPTKPPCSKPPAPPPTSTSPTAAPMASPIGTPARPTSTASPGSPRSTRRSFQPLGTRRQLRRRHRRPRPHPPRQLPRRVPQPGGAGPQSAQSACGAGFQPAPPASPQRATLTPHLPRSTPPYKQAGLTIARTLFAEPYLSTHPRHQGLLLHSVYHRPNGWDYVPPGTHVPHGESSLWGDYHARELALLIRREARGEPYLTFFAHSR
ncbi:MAG: glycoside hydrolase family 88 protein [Verrucomicrobia bacterium]|nr:glycoside hydrolase family 88 protein [Verrucomicrobiota bacterium]